MDIVDIMLATALGGGGGSVSPADIAEAVEEYMEEHPVDALPAVTSSDNGKALVVESGAWAAGNVAAQMAAVISGTDIEITNLNLAQNVAEVGA